MGRSGRPETSISVNKAVAVASKLWKAINNYVKAMASRPKKAKKNLAVKLYMESLENPSASLVDSQLAMTSP